MERVPQFINVEDHIGPLTWKQLGWLALATAIGGVLWVTLSRGAFWVAIIPIFLLAFGFGFLKPGGVSLLQFVGFLFTFIMQPKVYTWRREPLDIVSTIKEKSKEQFVAEKELLTDDIQALSKMLDSHGKDTNERIKELIKKNKAKYH